ncbi:MAG: YbaB/EbfC family nucleoid-associated protein [Planctomycetota bacterium]|nr:YbaB/EbfC family nucleoid-associated protein [Planctomycetota bacterium]
MFKGLSGIGSLLKQAQEMGGRMQAINEELKTRRTTGSAGGDMVTVEVNGLNEVLACRIDQQLIDSGDRELIEDLVASAVNQALAKAKELHAEAMQSLTGGMELPGLDEAMSKLMGGEFEDEEKTDD